MRSMHRYAIIALAVLALALATASIAAADVGVSGSMTGTISSVTVDPGGGGDSVSQFPTVLSEAIVNFSGKTGPVSFLYRLEANNDSDGTLNNTRNRADWDVTDQFRLRFNGASFGFGPGVAPFGATVVGNFTATNPGAGHFIPTQLVFNINQNSVEAQFHTGGMEVGLLAAGQNRMAPGSEATTFAPYYIGKFGSVRVDAYYAAASSKDDTGESDDRTELSVAGRFTSGQMDLSLQVVSGEPATDVTWTAINLGGSFGPIDFHYITETRDPSSGDSIYDQSDIAAAFNQGLGEKAKMTIGVASHTDNLTDGGSTTAIQFGVSGGF